jgi:cytochrome c oxidase subunit II
MKALRVLLGGALMSMMSAADLQAEPSMQYTRTFGPAVDPVTRLGWGLGSVSVLVTVVIGVLLLAAIFRKRAVDAEQDPKRLSVRRDAGGMGWIYIGVGTSTLVLCGCMIWTLVVIAAVNRPPSTPALTVQVTGSQWWWNLRYRDENPSHIFTTANEIHIPVGKPVRLELASTDVIHSFWIPQLAGKMDVIPGQTNVMWLQADQPGAYRGQCAAFCGAQHAHMGLLVVADSPEAFATWEAGQLSDTAMPTDATEEVRQGAQIFQTHCAACHTIRGIAPAGIVGPDLSHLMTRSTLAAGLLKNTPENLSNWIKSPESFKPGTRMPTPVLSRAELMAVTSYLTTLH